MNCKFKGISSYYFIFLIQIEIYTYKFHIIAQHACCHICTKVVKIQFSSLKISTVNLKEFLILFYLSLCGVVLGVVSITGKQNVEQSLPYHYDKANSPNNEFSHFVKLIYVKLINISYT